MAFEAFREQARARPPSRRRQLTVALSIGVHVALIGAGVAYSFWHVEELTPPTVRVTFLTAAPPPPPPPPPAGGGGRARPKPQVKPRPVVLSKTPEIVQPRQIPKDEPQEQPKPAKDEAEAGTAGGVAGGTIGGTVGGTVGGTPGSAVSGGPSAAPKSLAPYLARALKQSGPEPELPLVLRRPGVVYRVLARYCIGTAGDVYQIKILKGADSLLDANVTATLKTWRFHPNLSDGKPVPFCTTDMFEFRTAS